MIPYTTEELCRKTNTSMNDFKRRLKRLKEVGLVELKDNMLYIEEALNYTNQTLGAKKKQEQRKKKKDKSPLDCPLDIEEEKEIEKRNKKIEEREKSLDVEQEKEQEEDTTTFDSLLDYYSHDNIDVY